MPENVGFGEGLVGVLLLHTVMFEARKEAGKISHSHWAAVSATIVLAKSIIEIIAGNSPGRPGRGEQKGVSERVVKIRLLSLLAREWGI